MAANRSPTGIPKLSMTLLCSLCFPLCFSAIADDSDSGTEASILVESKSYSGSEDMPDGIAFYLVSTLIVDQEDLVGVQQLASSSDPSERVEVIASFADIDEAAAASLIEGIAPSARALLRESELEARKTACLPALYSWDNEKVIAVRNQLDDIREGVYTQHTIRAMIALDPEGQRNFKKLLRAMKLSSSYVRIDESKAYKGNPEGAKTSLLSYCNM